VRGVTTPRLWTPPLRELTPETSYGFELCEFARDIHNPLDPWQEFLAIHMGELLPDGRPRFRIVLVLVSRQNGKTHFGKVLAAWWLHVDLPGVRDKPTVLGISSKLDYAKESWQATVDLCKGSELLAPEIPKDGVRESNGEQTLTTTHGTRYKIAAANDDAGRSLTVSRLIVDELRRQQSWTAWAAAEPTTSSVPDAQILALTNQGDDRSVVLDSLRKSALEFIETGQGDPRLGIFEWSAPDGSDPTDPLALAQANPNLNHPSGRNPLDALMGSAIRAKAAGGEELAKFKIEAMCMRVHKLNPAIDPDKWAKCADPQPIPTELRNRVALAVDVSLDSLHATLVAAVVLPDGRVRVEVVRAWHGQGCTAQMRKDLPGLVRKVKPRAFGWLPAGPAAAVTADLAAPKQRTHGQTWPPPRVKVEEIRGDTAAICMGLAELVGAEQIAQPDDPLLNLHVSAAQKLLRGDAWVYARKDAGPIDGAYAAAAAVHLARTMPATIPHRRLIVAE
jgi:phage terminase large subunit-like protein